MRKVSKILPVALTASVIFSAPWAVLAEGDIPELKKNLIMNAVKAEGVIPELSRDMVTVTGNYAGINSFFGVAFRTKYIDRWAISIKKENESLNDHLLDTARIAHMLALIKNKKFGGNMDVGRIAVLAMYHDLTEVITGDMPTPIKYGHPQMKPIYNEVDAKANEELLSKLPEKFRKDFDSLLDRKEEEKDLWKLVKTADTMSAFVKCLIERSRGSKDFDKIFDYIESVLLANKDPEVQYFMKTFLPAFGYTYPEKLSTPELKKDKAAAANKTEGNIRELSERTVTVAGENAGENSFFGVAFRTKYIDRWAISIKKENESLNDHLVDTARIAHMLALIKNEEFEGNMDAGRIAVLAMYHDLTEVITGDMPTPIKYGHPQMKPIYNEVDAKANEELLSKLPEEFRGDFEPLLDRKEEEKDLWKLVKTADTMSAFVKCLIERSRGSKDFDKIFDYIESVLLANKDPEVQYFMKTFLPAFGYTYPENL